MYSKHSTGNSDKFSEGRVCLTPDCGEPAKWKGLCPDCYSGAKTLIETGETTWEKLQILGLCAIRGTKFISAYSAGSPKQLCLSVEPDSYTAALRVQLELFYDEYQSALETIKECAA